MPSRNVKGRLLHWTISHSRRVAEVKSVWAKLLYTWIIPSADNLGRMEGAPSVVAGMIFPREDYATPKRVKGWLEELHRAGLICWYEARGDRFIHVKQHDRHQTLRGNQAETSDFPVPPDDCGICNAAYHGVDTCGSEEKRREEKGREGRARRDKAERILAFLNERAGRGFREVDTNIDPIVARLKEGATEEECLMVIGAKCLQWESDEKMNKYLRPATLFNKTKFWQYHGEVSVTQ